MEGRTAIRWAVPLSFVAMCAAAAAGCGPSGGGSEEGADAGFGSDAGFQPEQRYPGYCRGLVHRDRDGEPDAVEYSQYDGELLKRRTLDTNRDGTIDLRTTFAYDDRDRLVRREIDENANGSIEETRFYEYGQGDRLERERVDENGDGSVDLVIDYRHDDSGRRVSGEGTSAQTGETELIVEYEWTEGNRIDLVSMDGLRGAPDGEPDRLIDYLYDTHWNLVEGRFDYDSNGRADVVAYYTYECWRGNDL